MNKVLQNSEAVAFTWYSFVCLDSIRPVACVYDLLMCIFIHTFVANQSEQIKKKKWKSVMSSAHIETGVYVCHVSHFISTCLARSVFYTHSIYIFTNMYNVLCWVVCSIWFGSYVTFWCFFTLNVWKGKNKYWKMIYLKKWHPHTHTHTRAHMLSVSNNEPSLPTISSIFLFYFFTFCAQCTQKWKLWADAS